MDSECRSQRCTPDIFLQIAYMENGNRERVFSPVTKEGEPPEMGNGRGDRQKLGCSQPAVCRFVHQTADQGDREEQDLEGKKKQHGQAAHGQGWRAGFRANQPAQIVHETRINCRPAGCQPARIRALAVMRCWKVTLYDAA
jgi:hypothetical protein